MIYTYQDLYDGLNSILHKKITGLSDAQDTINSGVRKAISRVKFRSTKRRTSAVPNIFNDIYDYNCPSDLNGLGIIDIATQKTRRRFSDLTLTTPEEFDRNKEYKKNLIAVSSYDNIKKLRIAMDVNDDSLTISELDSLTNSGGTWIAFGDANNLEIDTLNYIKGNASIKFGISSAGGTTAGIQNTSLDSFDLSDFVIDGAIFVYAYITDKTDITNYILRVGNDGSNYFTKTVTTNNEGLALQNGWNLLRFDLTTSTEVGTVNESSCTYAAIYMTKAAGKINETSYRFDWLVAKRGDLFDVFYYSKYPWQSSAGVYKENSDAVTDYINADTDEVDLMLDIVSEDALRELRDYDDWKIAVSENKDKVKQYQMENPDESLILTNDYYEFQGEYNR